MLLSEKKPRLFATAGVKRGDRDAENKDASFPGAGKANPNEWDSEEGPCSYAWNYAKVNEQQADGADRIHIVRNQIDRSSISRSFMGNPFRIVNERAQI